MNEATSQHELYKPSHLLSTPGNDGLLLGVSHIVHKSSLSSRQSESVESFSSHQFDSKSELEFKYILNLQSKWPVNFRQILPAKMLHSNGRRFSHASLNTNDSTPDIWYDAVWCVMKAMPAFWNMRVTAKQKQIDSWMKVWSVFVNWNISSLCHSQSCDSGQPFAGSTCLIQKPKHQWPWVYIWLSWHALDMRRAWTLTSFSAVFAHSQSHSPPEVTWPPRPGHISSLSSQVVVLNL